MAKKKAPTKAQAAKVDKETRERFRELLEQARAGDLRWLDKLVRDTGYGDPPGDEIVVSARNLEDGLNLSRRQIQTYLEEGMPRLSKPRGNKPATYEVWSVWRWMREYWKRVHVGGMDEQDAIRIARQTSEAKLLRERAEAELKAKEAGLRAGRLVERDKMEGDINNVLHVLQARLEGAPADIAAEAVGKPMGEIQESARRRISDIWNNAVEELRGLLPPKPPEPEIWFERERKEDGKQNA